MKLVAGAILVLAGTVLVSAAMVGVDVRNSTGYASSTESRLGYPLGAAVALAGVVLMALGCWDDRGGRGGPR
jgi:hypothetical protein